MMLIVIIAVSFGAKVEERNLKTFLPRSGETIDDPKAQLVQVLLDRKVQGANESYMVQVLFHSSPAEHNFRKLEDRIIIDFLDCGKPSMRLAKIRGGVIGASAFEELFYKEPIKSINADVQTDSPKPFRIKRMVRLTLFIEKKIEELKFRDTLDRTLIHFLLPEPNTSKGESALKLSLPN
jgi:hypothetical protein